MKRLEALENLERETPEFQNLTPSQQNERRKSLSTMLNIVLEQHSSLDITDQQAIGSAFDLLEMHLSGRIERVTEKQKIPKKRKK